MKKLNFKRIMQLVKEKPLLIVLISLVGITLVTILSPLLLMINFLILIVGLINPGWVLISGKRTRFAVIKLYGLLLIGIGIAGTLFYSNVTDKGSFAPQNSSQSEAAGQNEDFESLIGELNEVYAHHGLNPLKKSDNMPENYPWPAYTDESAGLFIVFENGGFTIEYDQLITISKGIDSIASANTNMNVTWKLLEHYLSGVDIEDLYDDAVNKTCDKAYEQVQSEVDEENEMIGHVEEEIDLNDYQLTVNCWWTYTNIVDFLYTRSQSVKLSATSN